MDVNSWWRNLNSRFKQYSTRVNELSKIAKGEKEETPEENLEKLKPFLQEDLSNLCKQLFEYCCTDEVKSNLSNLSNLSDFFSQQKKKSNISDNDLMYPMKSELFSALFNLLKKDPKELKNVPEALSKIKLFDWLKSTVEIWKTEPKDHRRVNEPWLNIILKIKDKISEHDKVKDKISEHDKVKDKISEHDKVKDKISKYNNVKDKISEHNNVNKIPKTYTEENNPCDKSLIKNSPEHISENDLREKRTEYFQNLRKNDAKQTTLKCLQQLVSMNINEKYLKYYKLVLKESPKEYREFVYVWYYLQKLTNETKINSNKLITNYIPSPTNLQQNENVNLSNCIKKCLADAHQHLTSDPKSFVALWEKEHPNKKDKMWKEIYNKCRNSCMKSYRPKSKNLKVLEDLEDEKVREEICSDLKSYMILTMHYALCVFTKVKDQSLLNYGPTWLKRLYDNRKGLTLGAIPTKETKTANDMRKLYMSHKKKWDLKPDIYKTLEKLLETLNMSIDDDSFPETLPETLKTELEKAKSNGARRGKVRRWLRLERKKLEEEIKNENDAIDLASNKAKQTIDKCENGLKSFTKKTNKPAKKKINV